MKIVFLALFGWLIPGGTYLLMRRYLQCAVFAILVSATFAAGIALHGGFQWPQAPDLAGLDSATAFLFKAGAFAKLLAGGPYLMARLFAEGGSFLDGRLHEYGTTLLAMSGLLNVLAISGALDLRKERTN